ncbi:hypothetical protein [Maribacter polysaccharolyticus]|uniref:hypothetical protein n=1 Tax=Maribacter polysaccharolyticus TaxID=3020831 RepID=UPI00237FB286|nr:hypothetical protein [Maribacter polysaccharolyticus]MDE3742098.1 hypothetical protein [Maribacter polysaccharolyticus]
MKLHRSKSAKGLLAIWLLLFTVATSDSLYAQEPEEDEIDLLLDDLFFNEQQFIDDILNSFNTYNFIYANTSFYNNTFFSGRDSGIDQFSIVPQLSYYDSSGFNVSVSGIFYETFKPNWDYTTVSVGYFNTLGKEKQVTYNAGYTRFFYSDGWDTFTNSLSLSLGLRTQKRTLGTKLGISYLFGSDGSLQITSQTYAHITIARQKKSVLKFNPKLNFLIAQQTIALEQLNTQDTDQSTEIIFNDIFDLLNTQINLPLTLSTKSWDFEVGYNINIPSPVESETKLKTTGFFNLSVGYLIDLDR